MTAPTGPPSTGGGDKFVGAAKNGLTSKIGGVPFYIYGIGFVAAFWAYKHFTAAKAAPPPVTTALVHPGGLPTMVGTGGLPGPSSGGVTSGTNAVNTANTIPGQLDAKTWIDQSTAYLAALGYDGVKAQGYLQNYLTGVQPTGEAARLVNLAVQHYGMPTQTQLFQPGATLNAPKLVRIVKRSDNNAIFGQYSDGSLHWFTNPNDLYTVAKSTNDPALFDPNDASGYPVKVTVLSANDPLWTAGGINFNSTAPYNPTPAT